MPLEFKTHPQYKPSEVEEFFTARGWVAEFVNVSNEDVVEAEEGLAVQCIDGRLGKNKKIERHGPKLPGGVYSVAALHTGGNPVGFDEAASLLRRFGYRPGTHEDCGLLRLWAEGKLSAARYPLVLPQGIDPQRWITRKHKQWEGEHFGIPKEGHEHKEKAVVFNPHIGLTTKAREDRFGYDHGLMQVLGIPGRRAMHLVAEIVEKISEHRKIEILTK